VHTLLATACN